MTGRIYTGAAWDDRTDTVSSVGGCYKADFNFVGTNPDTYSSIGPLMLFARTSSG